MQPVYFLVELIKGDDSVKSDLENLANDIRITTMYFNELDYYLCFGTTSKETYEHVFGAVLEYRFDAMQDLYGCSPGYTELRPAKIPLGFEGKIKSVELDYEVYARD